MGKKNQNHLVDRSIRKLLKEDKTKELLEIIDLIQRDFFIADEKDPILCQAVKKGNLDAVEKLIEKGARVSQADRRGLGPLHIAAKHGHVTIMNFLLRNGADVQETTQGGDSALFIAIKHDQPEAVDCLIEHGADTQHQASFLYNKDMALHRAAVLPDAKILNRILETAADIDAANDDARTALHLAAQKGCHWNVERLLRCGAQPNICDSTGQTALLLAADAGHVECVRLLCVHGASLNAESNAAENALKKAVCKRYINVVRTLIHFGADVNRDFSDGKTCLMATISNCCHKMVSEWGGKNWKKREDNCNINEEMEMLDILVAAGADLNTPNASGDSCLHTCVREGCAPVLEYLLSNGIDCELLNSRGETALSLACRHNTTPAIDILIKHCPVLVNHPSVTQQPPDPTTGVELNIGVGNFSPMVQLWAKSNVTAMRLLSEAGYRFSAQERHFFDMTFDEQRSRKRKKNKDKAMRAHLLEEFAHPWSLLRIARTAIRDRLGSRLPEKAARLEIPQLLQAALCLS